MKHIEHKLFLMLACSRASIDKEFYFFSHSNSLAKVTYNTSYMNWGLRKIEAINLKKRMQWYAFIRLLFLLAIAVPSLVSLFIYEGWSKSVRLDTAVLIIAVATNLLLYGLTNVGSGDRYHRFLGVCWIALDILVISAFIFINGGIESRSPILYTVPILIAAALFGRQAIYIAATTCASLYIGLILGDYLGWIHSMGAFDTTLKSNLPYVINTLCFFPAVFLVIALAVDFITSLLFEKQQEVHDSVAALETAQEIAKVGSWEWDIERDEISWSKELYRIHGLEPSENKFSYAAYLKLLTHEAASGHKKVVLDALRKKISFKIDHQITMPDGSIRFLHGEGRPVHNKDGIVVKMSGTSQDVTDIYHLDLAKREFVSLASHQLRTPASGVKAFLSLLMDGHAGKLSRSQRNFIRQAYDANDRQLEIIDNLLSLASIESGKLTLQTERVDLQELVKRCLPAHMSHVRARKQKLHFTKLRRRIMIQADPGALQMALDNLISNAIKYTLDRGTIDVSLRHTKTAIYIDVQDSGIGIARKDLPLLFQKFSRVSDPASKTVNGSGLGLYMAKYIVELHNGRIMVTSRHGVGTRFTIKLPISSTKAVK